MTDFTISSDKGVTVVTLSRVTGRFDGELFVGFLVSGRVGAKGLKLKESVLSTLVTGLA